jgi:hypothetical protein
VVEAAAVGEALERVEPGRKHLRGGWEQDEAEQCRNDHSLAVAQHLPRRRRLSGGRNGSKGGGGAVQDTAERTM